MEPTSIGNTKKSPIRIGILLNKYDVNYPYYHILETLQKCDYAEICLIILNRDKQKKSKITLGKILKNFNYLLFQVYQLVDKKLFKPKHNVLKSVDSTSLLKNVPVLEVTPTTKNFFQWISDDDVNQIKSYQPDILIRMGFKILKGEILKSAKYGIWSYHHADNKINRGGPPGFWEMFEKNPVTGTVVQILSEDLDNGQVLTKSIGATHKFSLNLSRNSLYAKSMYLMPRLIRRLYLEGDQFITEPAALPEFYNHRLYVAPTNAQVLSFSFRLVTGSFTKYLRQLFYRNQWFLLFSLRKNGELQPSMRKMKKLMPPSGTFWADPHVIYRDSKYYIFLEEKNFSKKNAHVSLIIMDEKGNCSPSQKILERPYHLSYPFVFTFDGNDYMIPETRDNKTVELYKCVEFPNEWTLQQTLLSNLMAVDCTLHEHNGKWWMFLNKVEHSAVSSNDELYIYHSASPFGPWEEHEQNPVVSDVRRARPAGKLFSYKGKIYRPSQDCSVTYGYGIRLNEIITLTESRFEEKEVDFIEPLWDPAFKGVHSFIFEKNLTLMDAFRKVRR